MDTKQENKRETKPVNLRIPQELLDYVKSQYGSLNSDIVSAIQRLKTIRLVAMGEIKGLFTKDEWMFFIDSMNGTMVDELFCCNVGGLVAHCEDSESFEGTATKYGVDIDSLSKKIKTLKGANIEAIYYRVSQFWDNPDKYNLEEYAEF